MPLHTKLLLYKQLFHLSMTYGIQLWSVATIFSINIFQLFKAICLCITNTPWYVNNLTLNTNLMIPNTPTLISLLYNKFHKNTVNHLNLSSLTLPNNLSRWLKRKWPKDLFNNEYPSFLKKKNIYIKQNYIYIYN